MITKKLLKKDSLAEKKVFEKGGVPNQITQLAREKNNRKFLAGTGSRETGRVPAGGLIIYGGKEPRGRA